jgi:hypothetical protein
MKPDRRGSWYLLTGIVLGVAFGLVYSWLISPVRYVDAPPYALRADYKDDYRALVAFGYMYSHDLLRAEGRLAQLKDDNPVQALALQAQRAIADGHPEDEARALSTLVTALGGGMLFQGIDNSPTQQITYSPTITDIAPTPLMVEPSTTPTYNSTSSLLQATTNALVRVSTSTAQPTHTAIPTPTPGGPFVLQETHLMCNINQRSPLIQVDVRDAAGQPVPSVEVFVTWQTGEDHFFTGLQPEVDLGYGDFVMTPDLSYSIQPANGGQLVNDLTAPECVAEDGSQFWGSWYLVFVQS